jgi:exosortase
LSGEQDTISSEGQKKNKALAMPYPSGRMTFHRYDVAVTFLCIVTCFTVWLFWPYFKWLAGTWRINYQDTFGYIVPAVSVWVVIRERKNYLNIPIVHSSLGWGFFLPGLMLIMFSRTHGHILSAWLAFPLYCYGLCLLIWGKARSRYLLFPVFLCLFLYPWDTLIESIVGFHLRLLSTWMAYGGLKMMGLGMSISGTSIETKGFLIDVAPACSGMTILKVLFFSGAIGAYLYQGSPLRKSLLWMSTVPLAVLLNMIRIVSVGIVGNAFSQEFAVSFFHQVSGMVFFGIGLLLLYGEALLLKRV